MASPPEAAASLAQIEAFAESFWEHIEHGATPRQRVHYSRDGLAAVHERLENLKGYNETLTWLWEQLMAQRNLCRYFLVSLRNERDDAMNVPGITAMVSRGMAADERRVAHDLAAIDIVVWLRRFDLMNESLSGLEAVLRQRLDLLRSERFDLGNQIKLINVAAELGAL